MTQSFVPLHKQQKKAQRAHYSAQRATWGSMAPTPRIVESRKAYHRKRVKRNALSADSLF